MAENQNINQKLEQLTSENTEFKREVSLFSGVNVLAGIMVGSGIFYLGSYVLIRSGMSMGLALIVWVIAGLISLLSGLCYAELGTMMPKSGGAYIYLREAYGERVAFMNGFAGFFISSSGSIAGLAVAFPNALNAFFPMTEWQQKALGVSLIVLLTLFNIRGVKLGAIIQDIFTVAKIVPIAVIIVFGLFMGQQTPDLSVIPASNPSIPSLIGMVAFAVVSSLWAYTGWTNINVISEEIKNPKKNIPLAIIISIVAVMSLYVVFNFAIFRTVPVDVMQSMFAEGDYFVGTKAATILFGNFGKTLVGVGMAVSIFGALKGCVMVFPRSYYAMAKDGLFLPSFRKLHPTYKTPVSALIASMIVSSALVCTRNLNQITSLVVFSGFIFNSLTFYAVVVLRKKYPDLNRPYKVWAYPFTVILIILVNIGLMANTFIEDPVTSIIGLVVPAAAFVLYPVVKKANQKMMKAE